MLSSIAVEVRPEGERLRIVPWVKVAGIVLQVNKEEDGRYSDEDIQRRAITIACEHCKESTMLELPLKVASAIMQLEAFNCIHGYCSEPSQDPEAVTVMATGTSPFGDDCGPAKDPVIDDEDDNPFDYVTARRDEEGS